MFSCSLLDFVSDMNSNSRQVVVGGGDNAPEVVPPTPGAQIASRTNALWVGWRECIQLIYEPASTIKTEATGSPGPGC